MFGWRARLGFLIPPGSPTTEAEMIEMAPPGVSVHFNRMVARGVTGSLTGQEDRNRSQIAHLDETIEMLAQVKPDVLVMAHTATSYTLGREGEAALCERIARTTGIPFITAFGSVVEALHRLGINRVGVGTPYDEASTQQCRDSLQGHGFEVVSCERLQGVTNIYDETAERAYRLACKVDHANAQAIFLSGVGMPTIATLHAMERDLGKPVLSSASAMMWNALRVTGVNEPVSGYGRLLALPIR